MSMVKSKWIILVIAVTMMLGAMWFFDSEPKPFVPESSSIYQIDTIGIKKQEFNTLLFRYFVDKQKFKNEIDSSASDHYRVTILSIGDPADFLNKNYRTLFSATLAKNGFEVKLQGSSPPYDRLDLVMNVDKEFVVVPTGVLAMLID